MNKAQKMEIALRKVMDIADITRPGKDASFRYVVITEDNLHDYSDWDIERLRLCTGLEYILVVEDSGHILYSINVSGDSIMQSIAELTNLLAGKGW